MQLKWYLIIICACALSSTAIIAVALSQPFLSVLGVTCLCIVSVIAIDGATATVCRLLPECVADHTRALYTVTATEKQIYEKLKIRAWKDKIPEIGHFTGFRKNRIASPQSPAYVKRFLLEICYGEIGHLISVLMGFLLLPLPLFPSVWLPVSIVVATVTGILNLLPGMVLRYNSYKLKRLLNHLTKHSLSA